MEIYVRKISLLLNILGFKKIVDPSGDRWRVNMIILGEKYPLNHKTLYYKLYNDFEVVLQFIELKNNFCKFISKYKIKLTSSEIDDLIFDSQIKQKKWTVVMKDYLVKQNVKIDILNHEQ